MDISPRGRRFSLISCLFAAFFCGAASLTAQPAPVIGQNGVLDSAGFLPTLAPGSIGSVFGLNLATGTTQSEIVPLPLELLGTSVEINGIMAPLFFASPRQINFQVPFEISAGVPAQVVVHRNGMASQPAQVMMAPFAPAAYIDPITRRPIIQRASDGALITNENPAKPDDRLIVYLNGIGLLDNPPPTGTATPELPLARSLVWPTVTLSDQVADVEFAGLTPFFIALGQLNIVAPGSLSPPVSAGPPQVGQSNTTLPMTIFFGSAASPTVDVPFKLQAIPEPSIEVLPAGLNFDAVQLGQARSLALTVRNTGQTELIISGFTSDNAQFGLSRPNLPLAIAADTQQSFTVSFRPLSQGRQAGILTIVSSDPNRQSVSVLMVGTGIGDSPQTPMISVSPTSLNFGQVAAGQSITHNVSVSNLGIEPLLIDAVFTTNQQFQVVTQPFPQTIPAQQTRLVSVRFNSAGTAATGEMRIQSSDPTNPVVVVNLIANTTSPPPPPPPPPPGTLDFGSVPIGQSARMFVFVKNPLDRPIPISSITTNHPDFTVVFSANPFDPGTARPPFNLAAGAMIAVTVRFKPETLGLKQGTLALHSSDPTAPPLQVTLRGVGIP